MYNFMSIWNIYLQNNKQQQCNTKHVIFAQIKSWVDPMSPSDIYHSRRGGCGQKKTKKKKSCETLQKRRLRKDWIGICKVNNQSSALNVSGFPSQCVNGNFLINIKPLKMVSNHFDVVFVEYIFHGKHTREIKLNLTQMVLWIIFSDK